MSDFNNAAEIAIQNRKFAKTCVEKKRRDRINKCLDELKDLMSQSDDKARYQKMEKAEILEMAVAYMRNIRLNNPNTSFFCMPTENPTNTEHQTSTSTDFSNDSTQYYSLAYRQCLNEFQNVLCLLPNLQEDVKASIMSHMTQRYLDIDTPNNTTQTLIHDESVAPTCGKAKKTKLARHSPYNTNKSANTPTKSKLKKQCDENNELRMNQMSIMTSQSEQNNISTSSESSACSPYLYHQTSKFGGSCSSLDSYGNAGIQNGNNMMLQPSVSPALSIGSDQNNSSHLSQSSNSSPALSACSSPISSTSSSQCSSSLNTADMKHPFNSANNLKAFAKTANMMQAAAFNFANFELYQNAGFLKMWRPW